MRCMCPEAILYLRVKHARPPCAAGCSTSRCRSCHPPWQNWSKNGHQRNKAGAWIFGLWLFKTGRRRPLIHKQTHKHPLSIIYHHLPSHHHPPHTFESRSKSQPGTAEPPQVLVHPAQEDLKFFNFGGGGLTQPNTSKSLKDGKAMC